MPRKLKDDSRITSKHATANILAGYMSLAVDLFAGGFSIMLKSQNQGNGFILNKGEHRHSHIKEEGRGAILYTCEYIVTGQLAAVIQMVT